MATALRLVGGVVLLGLLACWSITQAAPGPSDACRTLAAMYARAPEQFDAQALAALQACIAAEASDKTEPPAAPVVPAIQEQSKWKEWPAPAPWTQSADPWPYPTPW